MSNTPEKSKSEKALQTALGLNWLYRQAAVNRSPGIQVYQYIDRAHTYEFHKLEEIRTKAVQIARQALRMRKVSL